jgi:SAM-dependent methyltransferase
MTAYYDEQYFEWQKKIGKIGGFLNKFKFENEVKSQDVLMDFGCGGGYLLNSFDNVTKMGFEINKTAHAEILEKGISVYDKMEDIENNSIDTIISNHALEHVPLPLLTFQDLYKKIKIGGKLVIVIPCEQKNESGFNYSPNDRNQHLHTWCPMTFGNLATVAGFKVLECSTFQHQWCPDFQQKYNDANFHQRCRDFAKHNGNLQIKLIATKGQ